MTFHVFKFNINPVSECLFFYSSLNTLTCSQIHFSSPILSQAPAHILLLDSISIMSKIKLLSFPSFPASYPSSHSLPSHHSFLSFLGHVHLYPAVATSRNPKAPSASLCFSAPSVWLHQSSTQESLLVSTSPHLDCGTAV